MRRFRPALLACVLAAVCAAPAFAEPPEPSAKEVIGTGLLRAGYAGTVLTQMMDARSTREVVGLGGYETNPMLAPFANSNSAMYAIHAGIGGAYILSQHMLAKHHKFAAIALGVALNTATVMAAQHNYRIANQMRAQTR